MKLLLAAAPTPVVAYAVRQLPAAAGIQITASHNPPSDNGYKVYFDGGFPIVPPTDRDIENAIAEAPFADEIPRRPVNVSGVAEIQQYVDRAAHVRHTHGSVRVALTPMHGVGGEYALDALVRAKFSDVHVVESQFAPDPDFPTVAFPNPEEPGAVDELLHLAADVDAEIAIALDPDADRCAVGVPTRDGWRMLTGDETGWLLGDYILSQVEPGAVTEATVVASTVVSSRMLVAIAAGARRPPRRDADRIQVVVARRRRPAGLHAGLRLRGGDRPLRRPGGGPRQGRHQRRGARVRSCRGVARDGAARCSTRSTTWPAVTVCTPPPRCPAGSAPSTRPPTLMSRLRQSPPNRLAGFEVTTTDLVSEHGRRRTDALIMSGGDGDTTFGLSCGRRAPSRS